MPKPSRSAPVPLRDCIGALPFALLGPHSRRAKKNAHRDDASAVSDSILCLAESHSTRSGDDYQPASVFFFLAVAAEDETGVRPVGHSRLAKHQVLPNRPAGPPAPSCAATGTRTRSLHRYARRIKRKFHADLVCSRFRRNSHEMRDKPDCAIVIF